MGFVVTSMMRADARDSVGAVPALPVSVTLGVVALLLSWFVTQPFVDDTLRASAYS